VRWLRRWFSASAPAPALTPALRRRIRLSFEHAAADEQHFPSSIDPRIFHVRLILDQLAAINPAAVLDAGCGKGRFARLVQQQFPQSRVVGMDIAEAMLRHVPHPVLRCSGSLTSLPFASSCFDAVYATESLEHAVDIEGAVAELCRVLKSGGRIIVIDKNAEHFGRLQTPEWERWFGRKELEDMLAKHCRRVESRFISYWEDVEPDGMFLAWLGEK
jgi:ubiquinone/menaquinone biosynthesis C-methylase UbiE